MPGGRSATKDLWDLCECNYNVTTKWIESDGDTLSLQQNVSSVLMHPDTIYTTVDGVWDGYGDIIPNGATVTIDPISERWRQIDIGHIQITYTQYWWVDSQPCTVWVVSDIMYETGNVLDYDQILTTTNIDVYCDEPNLVLYSEWNEHLAPASSSIPSLSQWGMIILALLLLSVGILYFRKRQKTGMDTT